MGTLLAIPVLRLLIYLPPSGRLVLDLRRYGSVPHVGFGLGVERTVTWNCDIHHLREATAFPSVLEKMHP